MDTKDSNIVEEELIEQNDVNDVTQEQLEINVSKDSGLNYKYAGFWMRFWAYLLDLVVIGSVNRILINPIFRALDLDLNAMSIFSPVSIATAITFYAYFVLMTKYFGQTLGKMVFGLRVIDLKGNKLSWGTILFREWIGRFISTTIWITYAIVAFLPKKQGLHDLFSDTTVIHER